MVRGKRMIIISRPELWDDNLPPIYYWPPIGFIDTVRKGNRNHDECTLDNWFIGKSLSSNRELMFRYYSLEFLKEGDEEKFFLMRKEEALKCMHPVDAMALGIYEKLSPEEKDILGEDT
jgi:hypothetical protein